MHDAGRELLAADSEMRPASASPQPPVTRTHKPPLTCFLQLLIVGRSFFTLSATARAEGKHLPVIASACEIAQRWGVTRERLGNE
jgi:hypothetical protein